MPRVPVRIQTGNLGSRNAGAPASARSVPLPSVRMGGGVAQTRERFAGIEGVPPNVARGLDRIQDAVAAAMGLVKRMPFADGNLIQGVLLPGAGTVFVQHGLGRPAQGYFLTNVVTAGAGGVYRAIQASAAMEAVQIILVNTGAGCTVDVWVY